MSALTLSEVMGVYCVPASAAAEEMLPINV